MGGGNMTSREELQFLYELAFHPPRLSEFWGQVKSGQIERESAAEAIRGALRLHLALPESGYASVRALKRLAGYQAGSKPFVPVTFLTNIAKQLGVERHPGRNPCAGGDGARHRIARILPIQVENRAARSGIEVRP
jgi:hypothetical protein